MTRDRKTLINVIVFTIVMLLVAAGLVWCSGSSASRRATRITPTSPMRRG